MLQFLPLFTFASNYGDVSGVFPYILTLTHKDINKHLKLTSKQGTPIMRPLWFDFPNDPGCSDIEDQIMYVLRLIACSSIRKFMSTQVWAYLYGCSSAGVSCKE